MEADDLQVHPAANLFPMMQPDEIEKLAADFSVNGQLRPIALLEGQLLDGRNRLAACKLTGREPKIAHFSLSEIGGDPIAFVLSMNLHRRHLTDSQRAMVSTECEKLFAAEAKERQRAAGGDKTALVATVPQAAAKREPSARDKAAAALGVSGRTVTAAKRVIADGAPAVGEAVRNGKLSVSVAERLVRKVPDQADQQKIVAMAASGPVVSRNDCNVKQLIESVNRPSLHLPEPPKGKLPVGVVKGNEAIDVLKGILPTDEQYLRGHQIVADYIRHNFRLQPGRCESLVDSSEVDAAENCKRWEALLASLLKVQKLAEAMAEDGILNDKRLKEANEASAVWLLEDAAATLPALQLVMDVCCEAGGPL